MPIPLTCTCAATFRIKDELAGKRVKCPNCATVLTVPVPHDLNDDDLAYQMLTSAPANPAPVHANETPLPTNPPEIDDDNDRPQRKKEPKKPKKKARKSSGGDWDMPRISISPGIIGGFGMIIGGAIWIVVGLQANRLFIYPIVLIVLGIAQIFRSLLGGAED